MAKNLQNVIRLNEWMVDEKRRNLGDLLDAAEKLATQAQNLEDELLHEQNIAQSSPEEAGLFYANYAKAVIDKRERIAQAISDTEKEITKAREMLRHAYRELKKYEVAQEIRDNEEALEMARKDQNFLDEVAIQGFRRRHR